ncbi:hypothetical protein BU15DRAFT_74342 [Melanogaster broomeanus]|nr:hypothetical protein BU15DRAFT_74342 [Melanogaster broomeanus]
MGIGSLLIALSIAALGTSVASLVVRDHPSTAIPSIIITASTLFITALLWVAKRYLARALNSSTMNGEALCALSCVQFSGVVLVGSLIYRVWHGGWWVDSATSIVIALLFGWEGIKMVRWGQNKDFDGGCCSDCRPSKQTAKVETPLQNATVGSMEEQVSAKGPHGCCGKENAVADPEQV